MVQGLLDTLLDLLVGVLGDELVLGGQSNYANP